MVFHTSCLSANNNLSIQYLQDNDDALLSGEASQTGTIPTSSGSAGVEGTILKDGNYRYYCIKTALVDNSDVNWVRVEGAVFGETF